MNAAANKSKPEVPSTPVIPAPSIRILKIGSCPSLSGQSTLTYHIGCNEQSELFFRVYANSSSGYFSREWVSLVAIQEVFAKVPADGAITSFLMRGLFIGKSTNTPGFVFAAMLAESLVQPSSIVERCYECADGKEFFTAIQMLMDSEVNLDADDKPKKPLKKKSASEAAPLPA